MLSIPGLVQHVEGELGESIQTRDVAVARLSRRVGLGPPDLVWLQIEKGSLFDAQGEEPSEKWSQYHWVLGKVHVNEAEVAAYFMDIINTMNGASRASISGVVTSRIAPGSVPKSAPAVTAGIYCTYDAFSRTDLRVYFRIPGGVTCQAVSAIGVSDPARHMWDGAAVSSFLRSLLIDPHAAQHADPAVKCHWPAFDSPKQEAKSLHGPLERLACTGVLVAASFRLTCGWDVEGGARASETCAVASALGHYLLRPKSGETGARLLARLCPLWPAAGMALCQGIRDGAVRTVLDDAGFDPAEGSMGDLEDIDLAVEVLRECQFACMEPEERLGRPGYALRELARRLPGGKQEWLIAEIEGSWSERGATAETLTEMSTGLGLMVGEMLLDQGKLRGAAEWCEWAWKMQETLPRALRPIWLLATRIKVRVGTLTAALRTLNDCPAPPIVDPASLPANVFTVEAPMPFSTTSPGASSAASWGTHPAAAAYVRVDEELHWGGADRLAMLPGAELLPAHHLVLEESPRSSLYRAGPSVVEAIFEILSGVAASQGLQALAGARRECFVMDDRSSASRSRSHSGASSSSGRGRDIKAAPSGATIPSEIDRIAADGPNRGLADLSRALDEIASMAGAGTDQEDGVARPSPLMRLGGWRSCDPARDDRSDASGALAEPAERSGSGSEAGEGSGRRWSEGGSPPGYDPDYDMGTYSGSASGSEGGSESGEAGSEEARGGVWETYVAENGMKYYHNRERGVTQWERPASLGSDEESEENGGESVEDLEEVEGEEEEEDGENEGEALRLRGGGGGEEEDGRGRGDAMAIPRPLRPGTAAALGLGRALGKQTGAGERVGETEEEGGRRGSMSPGEMVPEAGSDGGDRREDGRGHGGRVGGAGAGKGEGSGDDGREMAGSGTRHRGEGSFGVEEGRGEEGTGEAGLEGDENGDDLIAELMAAEGAEEDAAPEAITRWLDDLFVALWEDVAMLQEWHAHERRHKRRVAADAHYNAATDSEGSDWSDGEQKDGGSDVSSVDVPRADEDDANVARVAPAYSQAEWLHLGLLALRLSLPGDAERAFRICTFAKLHSSASLTASAALCKVYSHAPEMAYECCAEVIKGAKCVAESDPHVEGLLETLTDALYRVVGRRGLAEVDGWVMRNKAKVAGGVTGSWLPSWLGWVSAVVPGRTPKWEAMLASVVRQAVTWRVPGYDVQ